MGLALVAGPVNEILEVSEARDHCRIDTSEQDAVLAAYIRATREHFERICGRAFVTQTWDFTIDREWPWSIDIDTHRHEQLIELPRPPCQSVTSISYVDGSGNTQTLASNQYLVDVTNVIGRIYPAYGVTWPAVRCQAKAITVRFVSGYGAGPGAVPEDLRQAARLQLSHYFDNRQITEDLDSTAAALIAKYKVYI